MLLFISYIVLRPDDVIVDVSIFKNPYRFVMFSVIG